MGNLAQLIEETRLKDEALSNELIESSSRLLRVVEESVSRLSPNDVHLLRGNLLSMLSGPQPDQARESIKKALSVLPLSLEVRNG